MGLARANPGAARSFPAEVIAVACLCALFAGCGDSCVAFFSNPGGGMATLSVNSGTCPLNDHDNGNVRLRFSAPPDSVEAWHKAGIQHVFLTLRGIEARLKPDSGEDSSEWLDLAPKLRLQPVQIDLLAEADDSASAGFVDEATLPTGTYMQLRIELSRNEPASAETNSQQNACATLGFNCAVTRDGSVHSLSTPTEQILISPTQPAGTVLNVLGDTTTSLELQFEPAASQIYTLGRAAWFNPAFSTHWTLSPSVADVR